MIVPVAFNVGLATTLPAVAVSYQVMVCPTGTVDVAVKVWIGEVSHAVISPPDIGAAGAGLIVKMTAVLVKDWQVPSLASA